MDWQQYEREIEEQFRQTYPSAQITHDAKLVGKFSKVERRIDLLIEERASDFAFRIVVDAKYRGRKIDVSDVEAFIGLTREEAGAHATNQIKKPDAPFSACHLRVDSRRCQARSIGRQSKIGV
jgi:hypothetical protein